MRPVRPELRCCAINSWMTPRTARTGTGTPALSPLHIVQRCVSGIARKRIRDAQGGTPQERPSSTGRGTLVRPEYVTLKASSPQPPSSGPSEVPPPYDTEIISPTALEIDMQATSSKLTLALLVLALSQLRRSYGVLHKLMDPCPPAPYHGMARSTRSAIRRSILLFQSAVPIAVDK